jgi:hypothetical protein
MKSIPFFIACGIFTSSVEGFQSNGQYKITSLHGISKLKVESIVKYSNKETALYSSKPEPEDMDEIVRKNGLEAGLFKAVTAKPEDGQTIKPQDLLKKYGGAYLVTSITLAIISYAICYLLVSNGVDVVALLEKVGIKSTSAASNAGTAAIAYAVHKAASPIRFPPTVALTPVVAGWLGKKPAVENVENVDNVEK